MGRLAERLASRGPHVAVRLHGEILQSSIRWRAHGVRRNGSAGLNSWVMSLLVSVLALAPESVAAAAQSADDIVVRDAWVRAARAGVRSTGGYLEIENKSSHPVQLTSVVVEGAGIVELHVSNMVNDRMSMRHVTTLTIPARGRLSLAPGGAHLMLLKLEAPLAEGTTTSMTLRFGGGLTKTVVAAVRPVVPTVPQ